MPGVSREHRVNVLGYYPQQPSCQIEYLWLLFSRYLGEREEGMYVEVGAHDGILVSNTWGLSERGWKGILIEPVPEVAEVCRRNYSHKPGVSVIQSAVSRPGVTQVELAVAGALTTANPNVESEYDGIPWAADPKGRARLVAKSSTLDELLSDQDIAPDFDVLVVDVEGFEAEVFAGFDLLRWRPRMLIVELVDGHPDLKSTASTDAALGMEISKHGYHIVYKDCINTVFVRLDVWAAAHNVQVGP